MYKSSARIPKNFAPEKYTILFSPDYPNLKYSMASEILINTLSDQFPYLILNGDNYNYKILSLFLYKFDNIADEWVEIGKKNEELQEHNHEYYFYLPEEDEQYKVQEGLYIPIEKKVNKGEKLKLKFTLEGEISSDMSNALYLSTNLDEKKELFEDREKFENEWNSLYKNLETYPNLSDDIFFKNLVTVFLSTPFKLHLNMPCFDEPCYKSIYSFSLELDKYFVDAFKQLKCVTNGSLIHVDLNKDKNKYLFTYSDSPLMPSYLFTFVIGNFDLIETVNENKTKIRVFTPIKNHHDGALCMNLAQYSLKFYEKFFDIPYFYGKLDFVPVPNMNYRAIENIGCIVLKNEAMLFSHFQHILEKKFISRTICHEISHMWFGDLVTMEWWDDIWLNEGFARCFEYLSLNEIQPKEYKYWDNFIYYIYDKALIFDESKTTHPIVRKIEAVSMIDYIFDTISYSKGSSVIIMLMHYIGLENFKKSISIYLKKYKYKNTVTSMLWECFDEVTKLKISELMNEWINFSGHPILNIDIISKENKYYFKLKQKSMLENDKTIWKLPVFIKSKNFEICRLISTEDYEISFEELALNYEEIEKGDNFVVFNNNLKGFYRVKYDSEILLNSILTNYRKEENKPNSYEDKKEKENNVSDYDIFGLLSLELKNINFENIKKILNSIKYIENSNLLLAYTKDIYNTFKPQYYKLIGFEEYIDSDFKKKEIISRRKEFDNFFISLVENNNDKLNSLVKKFFINEENKDIYRNQFNDEFDSLYLYFRCIIDNNEEIAKKVLVPNLENQFEFLNKNLKYTLIEIMMKYINLIKDENEQKKLINIIIKDYTDNYYSSSYYIRCFYQKAITNNIRLNTSLYFYLNNELFVKKIFANGFSNIFAGKANTKVLFDNYVDVIKKEFESKESNREDYENIYIYFLSSVCNKYYYYFKLLSKNENGSPLFYDVLINYFREKLKSDNGGEEELINLVNEIIS